VQLERLDGSGAPWEETRDGTAALTEQQDVSVAANHVPPFVLEASRELIVVQAEQGAGGDHHLRIA
jgi:hypothetical protein